MARRVVTAGEVLVQSLNGDAIALHISSETYYTLNHTAYKIWQTLISSPSIDEAIEELSSYYGCSREVIAKDVETLLDELRQYQLISITND